MGARVLLWSALAIFWRTTESAPVFLRALTSITNTTEDVLFDFKIAYEQDLVTQLVYHSSKNENKFRCHTDAHYVADQLEVVPSTQESSTFLLLHKRGPIVGKHTQNNGGGVSVESIVFEVLDVNTPKESVPEVIAPKVSEAVHTDTHTKDPKTTTMDVTALLGLDGIGTNTQTKDPKTTTMDVVALLGLDGIGTNTQTKDPKTTTMDVEALLGGDIFRRLGVGNSEILDISSKPAVSKGTELSVNSDGQDLNVFYQCKSSGKVLIEGTLTMTGGQKICFGWIKECDASWGNLQIEDDSSGIVVYANNEIRPEWSALIQEDKFLDSNPSSRSFSFHTRNGTASIKEIKATSTDDKIIPVVHGNLTKVAEGRQTLVVSSPCPSSAGQISATITTEVYSTNLATPPLKFSWPIKCNNIPPPQIVITAGPCDESDFSKFITAYQGGAVPSFQPESSMLHVIKPTDMCTQFRLVSDGKAPILKPPPQVTVKKPDVMWSGQNPKVVSMNEAVLVAVDQVCTADGITPVTLTLHLKDGPSIALEWMKECVKPKAGKSFALTAPTVFAFGGLSVILGGALYLCARRREGGHEPLSSTDSHR